MTPLFIALLAVAVSGADHQGVETPTTHPDEVTTTQYPEQTTVGAYFPRGVTDGILDVNSSTVDAKAQRLSDQVRAILEHFKQSDPVGFPGAEVPDPMPVPDMKQSFAIASMTFANVTVNGLSKFRFSSAHMDLADMEMSVTVRIDRLHILGNYTMCTWFSCSEGGFTVLLDGVLVTGVARLEVGPEGRLRAEEISLDVTFDTINMDFENLGYMMSVFQGIINKVGSFLFDNVKPFILTEVNANIRAEVDKQVSAVGVRFPSSMAPLDVMIADARKYVREMGYDPYRLPDYRKKMGPVTASVTNVFATGLASFYRVGNLSLWMRDHVLHAGLHVGTKRLRGQCRWEVAAPLLSRSGGAVFTVEYLQANVVVNQTLDTRQHPYLESLDLKLGNLQLKAEGGGRFDQVAEFLVNVLPNLLRYQIVNALERPIMEEVQKVLDTVDVEKIIEDNISGLDSVNSVDQ